MKTTIFALILIMLPSLANARPGGASRSALKDGGSMYGLCSQDPVNTETDWMNGPKAARNGTGASWCQDIESTLDNQMGCNIPSGRPGKNKLDTNTTLVDQMIKNPKISSELMASLEEACGPKIHQIETDPVKFKLFLKQLMAVLFIQENEWKSEPTSYMGAQGLGQLDAKSACGYSKCNEGCAYLCKTKITKKGPNNIGDHNNVKCTTFIATYWMAADGTMGKGSGDKGSFGAARYFQPFRNIDKKNRNGWMMPKLKKYCNERIDQDGGGTNSPEKKSEGQGKTVTFIDYWKALNS